MMPHPERMVDDLISNNDGVNLIFKFAKIINENYRSVLLKIMELKMNEFEEIKKLLKENLIF